MKNFNLIFPILVAILSLLTVIISNYFTSKKRKTSEGSIELNNLLRRDDFSDEDKNFLKIILSELKYRFGNREYNYLYNNLCNEEPQWNRIIDFLIKNKIISIHYFREHKKIPITSINSEELSDNTKVKFVEKNSKILEFNIKEYVN